MHVFARDELVLVFAACGVASPACEAHGMGGGGGARDHLRRYRHAEVVTTICGIELAVPGEDSLPSPAGGCGMPIRLLAPPLPSAAPAEMRML